MEKSKLMMAVIIVLLVALLGTVVGVAVVVIPRFQELVNASQMGMQDPGFDRTVPELRMEEIDTIIIGDHFLSNLLNDDGSSSNRMARVQLAVGINNTEGRDSEEMVERINNNIDSIRQRALQHMRNTTYQDLSRVGGSDLYLTELLEILQEEFRTNLIVEVLFHDFVVS